MVYLKTYKLFESLDKSGVDEICKKLKINDFLYEIDLEGVVTTKQDLWWDDKNLDEIPFKMNVFGNFFCNGNNLKSFKNLEKVKRFYCFDNPVYRLWILFNDEDKIEMFNDYDIIRNEDSDEPIVVLDRLNAFLEEIGKPKVTDVKGYKCI